MLQMRGVASGIVTLPINKAVTLPGRLRSSGPHGVSRGTFAESWPSTLDRVKPVMMLAGPELRAVPVTIHIPLAEVASALTGDDIVRNGNDHPSGSQRQPFGIRASASRDFRS